MFKRVSIILIKPIHARTMISYTLFPIPSIIYISPIHTSQHPNYSLPSFPASTPRRRPSRTRQRKHTIRPTNRRLRAAHGRRRRRGGRSGRNITPVMRHVRFDQMTSTQCAVEGKFTGEYASGDDAGELACVVAWGGGVRRGRRGGRALRIGVRGWCRRRWCRLRWRAWKRRFGGYRLRWGRLVSCFLWWGRIKRTCS
jgi:hypothetical protein